MAMTCIRPMRLGLALLALLATLSVSACSVATMATEAADQRGAGAPPDAGGGGVPDDKEPGAAGADEPVVSDPDPGASPSGDGALHVESLAGVVDGRPHAIDRISVAADGRTVTVFWWGGVDSCYGLAEVRVERDADGTPIITVLEGTLPDLGDVACIEIALLKSTTITLDEPLYRDGSQG